MNRQGPREVGDLQPRALSVEQAIEQFQRGAALLDTRTKTNFIARHVPGAVHLEADDQLPNRIGSQLPPNITLVLLLDDPADYERVAYMLARVGFDDVAGYLESLDDWEAQGYPVTSGDITDIDPGELETHLAKDSTIVVLDVREPWEYRTGHVPKAVLIPLGQLQSRVTELDPALTTAVICQSGSRSQTAAALLAQKGFKKILHVREGTMGWRRRGFPVEN